MRIIPRSGRAPPPYARATAMLLGALAAAVAPAHAANPSTFDLDGDGTAETVAASTRVAAGDLKNDFYDTINVGNPHAFTSLTFDWELPDAYRFKGGVPVGTKWSSTNHYDSYITPFEFSYSLNLTPAGCPAGIGCPATTRTADAWTPVNGYKVLKSLRDLFTAIELEGELHSEDELRLRVESRAEPDGALTRYTYVAHNPGPTSADLSWIAHTGDRDQPLQRFDALLLPGEQRTLASFVSGADPAEVAGQVRATVGGEELWFIAPMVVAVPEPAPAALLALGGAVLAWRLRQRKR